MKVGFLITARLKSTRLPLKLLKEVKGRPIICHMIDRVKLAKRVDEIIICTSPNEQDRPLVEIAQAEGVGYYCGDPDDVVDRLYRAVEKYKLGYALNITADCPFVDPIYIDRIIEAFLNTGADWIRAEDLPHGAYSWGLRPEALKMILEIKDTNCTEAWKPYFLETDLFKVYDLPIENPLHKRPELRMTLDYPEDLAFFEEVFNHLYQTGKVFSLDEILNLLDLHPEIIELNRHCTTMYKKRIQSQSAIYLKPRYDVTKAAVIGCGSVGQRHIRNLRDMGITNIVALRTRKGHFDELPSDINVSEVNSWDEVFSEQPDIAIVSNPTSLHVETIHQLLPHVRGIFIEKPLADSTNDIETTLQQIHSHKTISFVGYNLQFHKAILAIRGILNSGDMGRPLVFQCQVGHWLPDWHPYEDYRSSYAARKELGGGVCLTLIHEIHLAQELLGMVEKVQGIFPKYDALPLEVDVIADLMLCHASGAVSQIHLDYVQRPLQRCGVISCENGWIKYDLANPRVTACFASDLEPRLIWDGSGYDPNQQYIDEMETFIKYVREGRVRHPYDAWKGVENLAVVDVAFESARQEKMCPIPNWVHTP